MSAEITSNVAGDCWKPISESVNVENPALQNALTE